ncbi:MAG TPA: response regulator [Opitutaceae bacterium]|nr:response regulator [Opitutaceae bacterium]
MRILIAEDDITSRTLLSAVLQKNGHEPVEARDGAEALATLLREDAPRVAILDWMMPEIDGVEVCRRVRGRVLERPT